MTKIVTTQTALTDKSIANKIHVFRDVQVMTDRDLAEIYQVETRSINQSVKRNIDRFPDYYRFQLNDREFENWKSQTVMSNEDKMGLRRAPYVFTEQGIAMLSAVLHSPTAIKVSIQIMNAFVEMRHLLYTHHNLLGRVEKVEQKQLETDKNFEKIFKALESKEAIPRQGVFFEGQIFDAYILAAKIIRSAKRNIILIDNFIDESVLILLSKKQKAVHAIILTANIHSQLSLDIAKANAQYPVIEVKVFKQSHDRFLIIDETEVYHLGASLKDLGKKWFAFSKMDKSSVAILEKIKEIL